MKIATGDAAKAIELTYYIRHWKPSGWRESLHLVMFCPLILTDDYKNLKEGDYSSLDDEKYKDHFINAIKEYFNK
jgi:hypothetical protein